MLTRRQLVLRTLFGAGGVGLRALATGIPAAFFLNPTRAVAQASKAQYIVLSTSAGGDPIGSHAPGTYGDSRIIHSADPQMAQTNLTMGGKTYAAGKPWSTLPQNILDRTAFWHVMTNTPIHPKEPDVLQLMGATTAHEMLPSLLAKVTAPSLGCVQAQPFSVGGQGPSEALSFNGSVQPTIPPVALKDTLTSAAGPLTNLQAVRDSTMAGIYAMYKTTATPAQKAFIDATVASQQQVRNLNQSLLSTLSNIKDNSVASQILATVTLIQMNIAPVISIHVPFGGDNHADANLATETSQTVAGVASLASLMAQLQTAGLQDKVTFMSLNVFGRTLMTNGGQSATTGRNHNPNLQTSVVIGAPFKPGVIGAIAPVANDFGATAISSTTGVGGSGGDIAAVDTLGAFAQTMLAGVGGDPSVVSRGKVISAALA